MYKFKAVFFISENVKIPPTTTSTTTELLGPNSNARKQRMS